MVFTRLLLDMSTTTSKRQMPTANRRPGEMRARFGPLVGLCAVLGLMLAAGGCTTHGPNGSRRVWIIGFGTVAFGPTNDAAIRVADVNLLGLGVHSSGGSVGLWQTRETWIDPILASNRLIRIKKSTFQQQIWAGTGIPTLPSQNQHNTK
jgi:hypothetical protein